MSRQIRVACVGNYSGYFSYYLYGVMEGAILNGAWFRPVELNQPPQWIIDQLLYFRPHIIFTHMLSSEKYHPVQRMLEVVSKVKRKAGGLIVIHEGDPKPTPRLNQQISGIVDIGLLNNSCLEEYQKVWNIPCYRWPYFCLQQERIVDPMDQLRYDMVFAGNLTKREVGHLHNKRSEFIMELNKHLQLKTFPDEEITNTRFLTAEVSASAKGVLGFPTGDDVLGYLDTRPFQYTGAGALYFHGPSDAMHEFFAPEEHYIEYKGTADLLGKFNHYTRDYPDQGRAIRQRAFDYCQKYHSAKSRVKFVIDLWQGGDVKPPPTLVEIREREGT